MQKKEWILFDFDGTLFDTKEGVAKCTQVALKHFGIEEPDWRAMDFMVGPPLDYSFDKHYGLKGDDIKKAISIYRERYLEKGVFECSPYPGLFEALTNLRKKGYKIGVASSKPEHLCRKILENHGFDDLFDDVCGADEATGRSKKRDVLIEALSRIGDPKDPSGTVLVGDTVFDVEGAAELSMDCIVVSYGFGDPDAMKKAGALAVLGSLKEVDAFFEG